eukprot:TRINITY_DN3844_c0_g1_i6.p1 TRINITY_DN3844_c0_g1~~TRINITY_DN3844_c0_g1_i6.p1  ORF type:complete len:551 (+),score=161.97 TRINITY_DN3844_c0_g1_i6:190-1842(+)
MAYRHMSLVQIALLVALVSSVWTLALSEQMSERFFSGAESAVAESTKGQLSLHLSGEPGRTYSLVSSTQLQINALLESFSSRKALSDEGKAAVKTITNVEEDSWITAIGILSGQHKLIMRARRGPVEGEETLEGLAAEVSLDDISLVLAPGSRLATADGLLILEHIGGGSVRDLAWEMDSWLVTVQPSKDESSAISVLILLQPVGPMLRMVDDSLVHFRLEIDESSSFVAIDGLSDALLQTNVREANAKDYETSGLLVTDSKLSKFVRPYVAQASVVIENKAVTVAEEHPAVQLARALNAEEVNADDDNVAILSSSIQSVANEEQQPEEETAKDAMKSKRSVVEGGILWVPEDERSESMPAVWEEGQMQQLLPSEETVFQQSGISASSEQSQAALDATEKEGQAASVAQQMQKEVVDFDGDDAYVAGDPEENSLDEERDDEENRGTDRIVASVEKKEPATGRDLAMAAMEEVLAVRTHKATPRKVLSGIGSTLPKATAADQTEAQPSRGLKGKLWKIIKRGRSSSSSSGTNDISNFVSSAYDHIRALIHH